jgi:imidazolonepropionase-like amidohydrolase
MRKFFIFLLLSFSLTIAAQEDNIPVTGVSDRRPESYGLTNARVYVDHRIVSENTDLLISEGRIKAMGNDLAFPAGTIVYDLSGKTIYPSFIDIYAADYGIRAQSSDAGASTYASLMASRQTGRQQSAPEPRIADYWNDGINASFNVLDEFIPDTRSAGEFRQNGFGAVLTFKADGIARGTSALVSTGDGRANTLIIKNRASANYSFSRGRSQDAYPMAQFGIIALLRQLYYDAEWYKQLPGGYFHDEGIEAFINGLTLPQIFEVSDKIEIMRADRIGKEFNISYVIKGAGDEYQAVNDIKKTGASLIVPLNFPQAPDVKDPYDAATVSYTALKHYEMAPANLSLLSKAGIPFAITSSDLRRKNDFLGNLRKAVKYGLPEEEALKALTTTPAAITGTSDLIGSLKANMIANFIVTSGNIFSDTCVIYENWVQGKPYRMVDLRTPDMRGRYTLSVDTSKYTLNLSGNFNKPTVRLTLDSAEVRGAAFTQDRDMVSITFDRSGKKYRLTGYLAGRNIEGRGQTDSGQWFEWKADYTGPSVAAKRQTKPAVTPKIGKLLYPFVSYGYEEIPSQGDVLFRNATVWTNEKEGKLLNADVLVKDGKIARVGKGLRATGAREVDATGMHLTPGIIDEHSHIATSSTNESGQAITSEVRIGDVLDPENINIYRQLAGGVTAAHILHGSANPIGGQSALIKHRWGHSAEELKIENQPGFLKHALGENVKRSASRYPNTRMGVDQIIRDAYLRAVDYREKWNKWNALKPSEKAGKIPPRRDLELDAIVDVLEKRSFIECHTYVQSEGTMIMKLAEDFGLKVNSLIHFNEGYKVADQIARGGHGASVFSDWWDYKYEVYEGITYNAAVLLSQGVLTCLHSDDAEMGRRLNQEAAKTVKYGGVDEITALKLVTLNPAKLLHLDNRMGSIKAGKDADLVLWTDHPLSVYARASKTMVDGIFYFEEEKDALLRKQVEDDRNRIISNILRESSQTASSPNTSGR